MYRFWIAAALVAAYLPAKAQIELQQQMVKVIVENCLPKVSAAAPLPMDGLEMTQRGLRSPDGTVAVINGEADFTCQVIATARPEPVSEDLAAWAEQSEFVLVGRVPLTVENQRGLFLYGRAVAGGFVQIHVTNLPEGRLGALLIRSEQNRDAERALQ